MFALFTNWWTFVVRGILAILAGVMTFAWPGLALLSLVLLFGFYAIADGVSNIIAAVRGRRGEERRPFWTVLIQGILGVLAGLIALFMPGLTAITLLFVIAAWAIVTGALTIVAAIRLRKQIKGEWFLALSGALSIAFGALVGIFPGAGALGMVLVIGAHLTLFGVLLIVLGFKLRQRLQANPDRPDKSARVALSH